MAWQDSMVMIVRHLVNDIEGTSYSDSRLQETIVVAATIINTKVDFETDYAIDIEQYDIIPDPTTQGSEDYDFIRLVTLQASVILTNSETKTLGLQAYRISDGPSSIDTSNAYKALAELAKKLQDELDGTVVDYQMGNSVGGQAIMTPYTVQFLNVPSNQIRNDNTYPY